MSRPTINQLQAENDALKQELETLKENVRSEAKRVAAEQGWCRSDVRDSLRRIGVTLPQRKLVCTFSLLVTIECSVEDEKSRITEDDLKFIFGEDYLRDSVVGLGYNSYGERIVVSDDDPDVDVMVQVRGLTNKVVDKEV